MQDLNITDKYNYNNGHNLFLFSTNIKNRIVMYGKPRGNTNYIKWKQTLAVIIKNKCVMLLKMLNSVME